MAKTVGTSSASEFARRLRDRVAAHKYVMMPCGCSLHMIGRTHGVAGEAARDSWLPQIDVDLDVPKFSVAPSLSQAKSFAWLLDYCQRWVAQDTRFQWKPPPPERGGASANARWTYALQRILCSIEPRYEWQSLSWINMRRRYFLRAEYLRALMADRPLDQEHIAVLQVALPIQDALSIRKEAALTIALRQRQRNRFAPILRGLRRIGRRSLRADPSESVAASSTSPPDSYDVSRNAETSVPVSSNGTYFPGPRGRAETAIQFHVHITTAQLGLFCASHLEEHAVRRPLIWAQAVNVDLLAAHSAPRLVWSRLAPPACVQELPPEGPAPSGVVMELTANDVRAVCYTMPTSAPRMRRLFSCGQVPKRRGSRSRASCGSPGSWCPAGNLGADAGAPGSQATMRLRGAQMRRLEGDHRSWRFAAVVPTLEVNICKPLLQALLRTVRPPPLPQMPLQRRFADFGVNSRFTKHKSSAGTSRVSLIEDHDPIFWGDLLELGRLHAARARAKKKWRRMEKLMGAAGLRQGGVISGSVLLLGGLRSDVLEPFNEERWLRRAFHLPPGTLMLSRGGKPPELKVGFRPLASGHGACGPAQAADGWWFETAAEAKVASDLLGLSRPEEQSETSARPGEGRDQSCAGEDAQELPVQELLADQGGGEDWAEGEAWRPQARAPYYRPRASERGMLPTPVLPTVLPSSPRRSLRSASGTALPFCCNEANMRMACAKRVSAWKMKMSTVIPSGGGVVAPNWRQRSPAAVAFARSSMPVPQPARRGSTRHATASKDMDIWLESLTAAALGLPTPELAEDLWIAMGCTRGPRHSPFAPAL
mmetsp:Transcript_103622/g.334094  ORF Transcript_103622/g.334094 Transcript_103622/m.334094 type:complete len:823 (-) Transcript_103622:81-2549(-)